MKIKIKDYPQLLLISWSIDAESILDGAIALALYERNWRYVEVAALEDKEKTLIDNLVKTYGNGVLNV